MWIRFRKWKHAVVPALVAAAFLLVREFPEHSGAWNLGLVLGGLLGLAYVVKDVAWIVQRTGRPRPACGQRTRMKSFRGPQHLPRLRRATLAAWAAATRPLSRNR